MSARIGFVEARSRLGAKQEAKLNAKAEKVEDNKKMFTLGKLTRTLSSKKPKRDAYGVGARVAFQAQLQERANTDACNKSGHLEPGHIYRPQDAQKKKRVEEWLDDLNQGDDDKQGGGNSKLPSPLSAMCSC